VAQPNNDNTIIRVYNININNCVMLHNGYYYGEGKEYWKFANRHEEIVKQYEGVDISNGYKDENSLTLSQKIYNYIINSAMNANYLNTLCTLDFVKNKHIPEISRCESITPCDSYNGWYRYGMDVSLIEKDRRIHLSFSDNKYGFAVLNLTPYISGDSSIYIKSDTGLTMYLAKDIMMDGEHFRKSIFAEPYITIQNGHCDITDYDKKSSYYLVVTGTGMLQELIITEYNTVLDPIIHHRNIDKFNMDIIEKRLPDSTVTLAFDSAFSQTSQLEFDRKDTLLTGSNIDYGITLLQRIDFDKCQIDNIRYTNDVFTTNERETGYIITEPVEIENRESFNILHLCINSILLDSTYTDFTIELLTCNTANGTYKSVYTQEHTNSISVNQRLFSNYIKAKITMIPNKVIHEISVSGEYSTVSVSPHIHTYESGTMWTKIFDTCSMGNYVLKTINYSQIQHADAIKFLIRGYKQDTSQLEWTEWKFIDLDENGSVLNSDNVIFRGYRMFQIAVLFNHKNALLKLDSITMGVIE
jgi:hypothetical protein